jgi:two-component system chemotaxis sensor kinase CheA
MAGGLSDSLERLAELLVLAEIADTASLEAVRDELQAIVVLAEREDHDEAADCARAALTLASELVSPDGSRQTETIQSLFDATAEMRRCIDDPSVPATDTLGRQASAPVDGGEDELMADFAARSEELLDDADMLLLALEQGEGGPDAVDAIFRAFHTVKGMAGFLSLDDVRLTAHRGEELLDSVRQGEIEVSGETVDGALAAVDALRRAVRIVAGEAPFADAADADRRGARAAEGLASRSETPSDAGARGSARSAVRVDSERLDLLLDAIGELVIAESMVSRTVRLESSRTSRLVEEFSRLDKLTRQLQGLAGSLRLVPLRPTFQKMARAVRDIARRSGKQVELVMSGEDTEMDRAVVDRIADPLLHLVRNAVDHGIEEQKDRMAAGKPPVARVSLNAFHRGGTIHIEVADDGQGLPTKAIAEAAVRAGLIGVSDVPTERELLGLICEPGLSTTATVTDVSGRGVGMDVVRRTVEALQGQMSARTEQGRGCTFAIRLPVTLAIIDGMVVKVGPERYIVPTLSIVRSVRPAPEQVVSVLERGEVLSLPDGLVRLISLRRVFDIPGGAPDPSESIVMVVEDDGSRAGLVVDEILGQQQIVIKPLGDALPDVAGVSGGAVMPDGRVGLILDVGGLVALANQDHT